MTDVKPPTHGFTKHGQAVHGRTQDHLPEATRYQRFNKKVAIWITKNAGSMSFFWVCWLLCFTILPSVLYSMGLIPKHEIIPAFFLTFGFELLMTWFASTVLELVLMPAIMVGQNIQSAAADVRSTKQFEDTEDVKADMKTALDRLDIETAGGLKAVIDRFDALDVLVKSVLESVQTGTKKAES
jgi:uncharacterized membrane protein